MSINDAVTIFDSDVGFGSEDDFSEIKRSKKKAKYGMNLDETGSSVQDKRINILLKLQHRQRTGYFTNHFKKKTRQLPFPKVPVQLSYCLKEVIPCCYLEGHIFMGLTACGQFLISYKGTIDSFQFRSYDITALHRYELYFWVFRPHYPIHKFIRVCLFDDHGVDGQKKVTMTQWSSDSTVLIVHGESDSADNDSYVTYVRVPKLGCLNCREMRDEYYDGTNFREAMRCIKCAMTVHIKYRIGESVPNFNPSFNLNCPNYVIMSENTFIHAVSVELETRKTRDICTSYRFTPTIGLSRLQQDTNDTESIMSEPIEGGLSLTEQHHQRQGLTIADEIIADFEEYETEGAKLLAPMAVTPKVELKPPATPLPQNERRRTFFQKLDSTPSPSCSRLHPSADVKTNKRSVTKEKLNPYEFSEENEKCEKISTFRKRRLADKKYEFSEETFDNILPFNRIRERVRSRVRSTPISSTQEVSSHLHRSPSHGFRSPCGSPVGYRFLRSPPGFSSPNYQRATSCSTHSGKYYCPMGLLSPRQQKRHDTIVACPLLSPNSRDDQLRRNLSSPVHRMATMFDSENNENHNSSNAVEPRAEKSGDEPWKLACSKKFTRYFVEEDDANSVVTTEEDDCISPGYHTSLPLEVHGACYSDMQAISKASYCQLRHCAVVKITQNTFDTEAFTVHIASHVCNLNSKIYDMLSDSTYTIVHVCPITYTIICLMRIEFFANDKAEETEIDEVYKYTTRKKMRKKYLITPLFTWNIEDSSLHVISYGKLHTVNNNANSRVHLNPKLGKNLQKMLRSQINIFSHLRIHTADITKTKERLTDLTNMVEFYRDNHSSDFSSSESSEELSDTETSDTGQLNSS